MRLSEEPDLLERKRTRTSLDVKVDNGENLTRPPKSKKNTESSSSSSHFDLSDLEGMSEEQIMQVLYDDPELAAAAAAAAEKLEGSKPKGRTVSEYPQHLRAMMDEGIPIKQWIVLMVLMGAGLYQLRKALISGNTKKVEKTNRVERTARKGGKIKGKKKTPASPIKARSAAAPSAKETLVAEEVATNASVVSPNKVAKKKKPRNTHKNKPAEPAAEGKKVDESGTRSHESPDSISTDGSSSTTGAAEDQPLPVTAPESKKVKNNHVDKPSQEEGGGWQTVGAPGLETGATSKSATNLESKVVQATPPELVESPAEPLETAPAQGGKTNGGNGLENATPADVPDSKSPKKKKAKKKVAQSSEVKAPDDEALAKQLQLQEEKIAKHEASKAHADDVWEEVTIKKKKRGA